MATFWVFSIAAWVLSSRLQTIPRGTNTSVQTKGWFLISQFCCLAPEHCCAWALNYVLQTSAGAPKKSVQTKRASLSSALLAGP
jgi:hypothetical protein